MEKDNMSRFNVKSIFLGIGIGIIITATVSMIYISNRDPLKDATEQQIINRAEKYGMVKSSILKDFNEQEKN